MEVDQNLGKAQILVQCVVVMVKLDLVKAFLLYSKLVHNVQAQVKKLRIHVHHVADKEKNKPPKDYLSQFQKALMTEQE